MPVPTGLPESFLPLDWEDSQANAEALEEAQQSKAKEEAQEDKQMGTPKTIRPRRIGLTKKTKKTKETKAKKSERPTKQRGKRQTKKEQDEQAVKKFLASPAWEGHLRARISAEVHKQRKSAQLDKVNKKTEKVMREWALLGDGNPEQLAEEQDCLVTYIGKMVELQLKRKRQLSAASNMFEINAAYSRIKHDHLQRIV